MRESSVHHAATLTRAVLALGFVLLLSAPPAARAEPPWAPESPGDHKHLVEAARMYFDLDEETWRGRQAFLEALGREADEGRFWLKDMDALRWLVYQGRSFEAPMTDRKWRRKQGIGEYKRLGGTLHRIKSEHLSITFSLPKKYPREKHFRTKYPRHAPYPLLLTMHEKRDYTLQKYPGDVLLKRRYPRRSWSSLYDDWLILCPAAAAGNYLDTQDMIRPEVFHSPYAIFWKHYHVDFDRVILDGTAQAFQAAAALPIFFAGIVFRSAEGKPWELSSGEMKRDVRNFVHVPVYVVDNPTLARQLEEAGHKNVTADRRRQPVLVDAGTAPRRAEEVLVGRPARGSAPAVLGQPRGPGLGRRGSVPRGRGGGSRG